MKLVHLIHLCLAYDMKASDIEAIRVGFQEWVVEYEKIFYQCDPERISTCPVTLHSLLHVADGIEAAGPVWTYWSFVMERFCGFLKRDGVRSRRKPYASLDNRVRHVAQLHNTKIRYNLVDLLSLTGPTREGGEVFPEHPQRVFMQPRRMLKLDENVRAKLTMALITRFSPLKGPKIPSFVAKKYVPTGDVLQWGWVKISEGGDKMCCHAMIKPESLGRDCTYIRYEATVDRNARAKNKQPNMVLKTFFGELQRVIRIDIPATPQLNLAEPQALFFAIIKQCNATQSKDGFWEYTALGGLEAIDIELVQCVVGRLFDRGKWVIIDRSGERAHVDIGDV
ncbi:hypothetical protein BJ322DRAFT_422834 [Thelephora terrestris]|uniref:DUF4218 domain-containing protein n=1 Tax=Thelephora terrestris TaxID=56493 RepID=A0A9P6HNY2_9AGAM|nr:hypothetical protein BJ322DRAFT_422834 [Thelephora terrestris]